MDQIKQRFSRNSAIDAALHDRVVDAQESVLGDDSDAFELACVTGCDQDFSLRLKLSDSSNIAITDTVPNDTTPSYREAKPASDDEEVFQFDGNGQGQTVFEVVSTETVKERKSTYVIYRILLTKNNKVDRTPCMLDKRFSDFEKLHTSLKKAFPNLMEQISFPRKQLTKNFTCETIAYRSRAFEQYLSHIYSLDCLHFSDIFAEFFFLNDLKMSYDYLCQGDYLKSMELLKMILPIQDRIMGEIRSDIGATMCALLTCYQLMEDDNLALQVGVQAIDCFSSTMDDKHYLPLLQTCIHLCWKLGKDKEDLEKKFISVKSDNDNIPSTLLAVVLEYAESKLR